MLHFAPCSAVGMQGEAKALLSQQPLQVSLGGSDQSNFAWTRYSAWESLQAWSSTQEKKHGEKEKIHSFAGTSLVCVSHLDLFREAKGCSVTVKCKDFSIYPQMNFFDVPLTASVIQPTSVVSLSKELVCLSRIWHPRFITEVRKSSCSFCFCGIFPPELLSCWSLL